MCAIVCILLAFSPTEPTKEELIKKELAKLQGTWLPVSAEMRGEKYDLEGKTPESFNMVISGNKMSFGKRDLTFSIDPTTNPKLLDLTHVKDKASIEAIYRLEGDTVTLCYRPGKGAARDRPTAFKTDENSLYEIRVYKRMKSKK